MSLQPDLPAEADVVIVGGGVIGTSIAYFLASETDLEITLLEKNAIGSGSTGDSSAIIRHHYGEKEIYTRMAIWSHRFYREFEDVVGEPIAYTENPRVTFAEEGSEDAAYAEAGYEILSDRGIPVSRYESNELDEQYSMLSLEEFDFAVSDDTAAYSDGTDVAAGFARAAQSLGADVITGVEVEGFNVANDTITGLETEEGPIRCEKLVLAAGPWTPRLAEELDIEIPITPSREKVLLLEPSDEFCEDQLNDLPTAGLPGGFYIRSEFNEGVLIATHHSEEDCDPDFYDNNLSEDTLLELHSTIQEYVPGLDDAGIQGEYSGVYANTPDHDFILDQCGPEGCYAACGFSGHGFKQAPAVGKIMSDLIETGETDLVDRDYFSLFRFDESAHGHGGGIEY